MCPRCARCAHHAGAVLTYAEWAPLTWLKQAGLIGAAGFLLGTLEFREGACDVLRLVAGGWCFKFFKTFKDCAILRVCNSGTIN